MYVPSTKPAQIDTDNNTFPANLTIGWMCHWSNSCINRDKTITKLSWLHYYFIIILSYFIK